jgi:tRNA/tmRNA/rRNA uracil-C5-methylase (TrmA/RlmC/RlmD family)
MLLRIQDSPDLPQPENPVEPPCPYFGRCGGCAFQHFPYEEELEFKRRKLREVLLGARDAALPPDWVEPEPVVPSPRQFHYRHRLDLTMKRFRSEGIKIGYTERTRKYLLEVDECPIGMEAASEFIPELKETVRATVPDKYRTANLVVKTGDEGRVDWGGIGRGSLRREEADWLWTEINGRRVYYGLDTFFQANLSILPELDRRLGELLRARPPELFLDLYGGVGLFSILAADHAREVVLIEENPASVIIAEKNVREAGLANVEPAAGCVEDVLAEKLAGRDLGDCLAMVDPPRKGLTPEALELLDEHLERMLYMSCNPQALARDLAWLTAPERGWRMERVMPFDFFPQTPHLETLVLLEK